MHVEKTLDFIQPAIPPIQGNTRALTSKDSDLRTPHGFFNAAYEAGYRIVVASFRENQLARDVSSYKNDHNLFNVRPGKVTSATLCPCANVF